MGAQEIPVRTAQLKDHLVVVDDLDGLGDFLVVGALAVERVGQDELLAREDHVLRRELTHPVLELHALTQLEANRGPGWVDLPFSGELRHKLAGLGINADEVLVHRPKLPDVRHAVVADVIRLTIRRRYGQDEPVGLRRGRAGARYGRPSGRLAGAPGQGYGEENGRQEPVQRAHGDDLRGRTTRPEPINR